MQTLTLTLANVANVDAITAQTKHTASSRQRTQPYIVCTVILYKPVPTHWRLGNGVYICIYQMVNKTIMFDTLYLSTTVLLFIC